MKKLIRYQLADGNDVVMEVDDPQSDNTTLASPLGEIIENVGQKLDDVLYVKHTKMSGLNYPVCGNS